MDTDICVANGGVPHADICPGPANIQCCKIASVLLPESTTKPADDNSLMLTDLADVLRNANLNVIEVTGWETRGHGGMKSVQSILVHHTAGPADGDFPSLETVRDGRPDLSGPLAQLGLGRTGRWYVIAAGRCYHAGATIDDSLFANSYAIGIEAEGTGVPEDNTDHKYWPKVQWQSYVRGVRALQTAYGVPSKRVLGHKEAAAPLGRKTDPNFSMEEFRAALEAFP